MSSTVVLAYIMAVMHVIPVYLAGSIDVYLTFSLHNVFGQLASYICLLIEIAM